MSDELTRVILNALIFKPSLLESFDLCADDFSVGRWREVFSLISEIWESERPAEIDIAILAERLGGDAPASFIAELVSG